MNYGDLLYLSERYGGSKKLRGIWYHGTSMKYLGSIMSQGLIPDPSERSWDIDPDASVDVPDRTSYGGIYLSRNMMTAMSSAWRTAKKTGSNRLLVMVDLQPKSLVADEDSIVNYVAHYSLINSFFYYKVMKYGSEYKEYLDDLEVAKEIWANDKVKGMLCSYDMSDRQREVVRQFLRDYGFAAVVTRNVSYSQDDYQWRRVWDDRREDIPPLPSKEEGERIFRSFVDKLTRIMKNAPMSKKDLFSPTGRSLAPIRFSGSNRIVCIVEFDEKNPMRYFMKIHYGELPQDFIKQFKDRISNYFDPTDKAQVVKVG